MVFDISNIGNTIGGIAAGLWKWGTFFIVAVAIGVLFYLIAVWWNRKKRYNWAVNVYEIGKDGRPRVREYDRGAIIMDKKKQNRVFSLKKLKVGLSPDKIPFEDGPKGVKIVNVLQLGLKQFRYLDRPVLQLNSPITMSYGVGDEDVAWAINTIDHAKMYEKKSTLDKLIPFLGMAFVFVTVVVALYFLFVKAGFNGELLTHLADSATELSKNLAAASSGTTVVQSG